MANFERALDGPAGLERRLINAGNGQILKNFTIETWLKTATTGSSLGIVSIGINGSFLLSLEENGFVNLTTNPPDGIRSTSKLNDGDWHHIAVTVESTEAGSNIILYVDGERESFIDGGPAVPNIPSVGAIGNFGVQLDEFRVWSSVRSQQQIQDSRFKKLTGNEDGLQTYYQFDDDTVTDLAAAEGQNNGRIFEDLSFTKSFRTEPKVTISSLKTIISEKPGEFEELGALTGTETTTPDFVGYVDITIDRPAPKPGLIIGYQLEGTATEGIDFYSAQLDISTTDGAPPTNSIFIPQGEDSARLYFTALPDAVVEGDETIQITLLPDFGDAIQLNGAGDYVEVNEQPALRFDGTKPYTMAAWIKPEAAGTILGKFNRSQVGGYFMEVLADGTIRAHRDVPPFDTSETTIDSSTPINFGEWNHVAVTYAQNGDWKLFINGQSVKESTSGSQALDSKSPLLIGARLDNGNPSNFFKGAIDEVQIWDKALANTEVQALRSKTLFPQAEPNLVGYWDFNSENFDGSTIKDISAEPVRALSLDGIDDYVEIPDSDAINFANNDDFTIETRVKIDSTQPNIINATMPDGQLATIPILEKWSVADGYPFAIRHDSIGRVFVSRYGNPNFLNNTTRLESDRPILRDRQFHHIAFVRRRGILELYIDGVRQRETKSDSPGFFNPNSFSTQNLSPLFIGRRGSDTFQNYFKGEIDYVRIWNRPRTESEIQQNQNREVTPFDNFGLVGEYTFEGSDGTDTPRKINLSANNGKLLNGATTVKTKLRAEPFNGTFASGNKALSLDGEGGHVSIPSGDSNFASNQNFTVETLVKVAPDQPGNTQGDTDILEKWSGVEGYPFVIRYIEKTGKVVAARFDGSNNPAITSTTDFRDGQFHHVAFVKDGDTLNLYIDGKLEGSTPDTTIGNTTNSSPLFIGRRGQEINPNYFKGEVDEVRIWNDARTQAEIQQNLNQTLSGNESGLVGYYNFNNNNGTDSSRSNNNGSLQNSATTIPSIGLTPSLSKDFFRTDGITYQVSTSESQTITIQDSPAFQTGIVFADRFGDPVSTENPIQALNDGTGSFQIKLSSQPVTDVTITLSTPSGALDFSTITFNASNWDTYQTVNLSGLGSAPFSRFNISANSNSNDSQYNVSSTFGVTDSTVDDTPKVKVTEGGTPQPAPAITANVVAVQDALEGRSTPGQFVINLSAPAPTGGFQIPITLSGTANTADYSISGASGTSGSRTATVPEGQTSISVGIEPVDNETAQTDKTIILSLGNGQGEGQSATLSLKDDDRAAVEFASLDNLGSVNIPNLKLQTTAAYNPASGTLGLKITEGASRYTFNTDTKVTFTGGQEITIPAGTSLTTNGTTVNVGTELGAIALNETSSTDLKIVDLQILSLTETDAGTLVNLQAQLTQAPAPGETVTLTLTDTNGTGSASFTFDQSNWDQFQQTSLRDNILTNDPIYLVSNNVGSNDVGSNNAGSNDAGLSLTATTTSNQTNQTYSNQSLTIPVTLSQQATPLSQNSTGVNTQLVTSEGEKISLDVTGAYDPSIGQVTLELFNRSTDYTLQAGQEITFGNGTSATVNSNTTLSVGTETAVPVTLVSGSAIPNTTTGSLVLPADQTKVAIRLNSQPTSNVALDLSLADATEGQFVANNAQTQILSFTTNNWNQYQEVSIRGLDDALNDQDITYRLNVVGASANGDSSYRGSLGSIAITNEDNESTVEKPTTSTGNQTAPILATLNVDQAQVAEDGTLIATVQLDQAAPTDGVYLEYELIGQTASLNDDIAVQGTAPTTDKITQEIFFPEGQTSVSIAIPVVDDPIAETNENFIIRLADGVSEELQAARNITDDRTYRTELLTVEVTGAYNGLTNTSLQLKISGDNVATFSSYTLKKGTQLSFNGGQTQVTVNADTEIAAAGVAVPVSFNLGSSQNAIATAVTTTVSTSAADVSILDNDAPGVRITTDAAGNTPITGSFITTETGTNQTFYARLETQPQDPVSVFLATTDSAEGLLQKGTPANQELIKLVFTKDNWQTTQAFTVAGQDDPQDDGNIEYQILTTVESDDFNYREDLVQLEVSNYNSSPGTLDLQLDSNTLNSYQPNGREKIALSDGTLLNWTSNTRINNTTPTTVSVTIDPSTLGSGATSVKGNLLVTAAYNPTQNTIQLRNTTDSPLTLAANETVTFTNGAVITLAQESAIDPQGNERVNATLTTGPNSVGSNVTATFTEDLGADITLRNTDNDTAGLIIDDFEAIAAQEGVSNNFYSVRLATQPQDAVVVKMIPADSEIALEGKLAGEALSITFTQDNWNTPQTIGVTAVDDFEVEFDHKTTIGFDLSTSTDAGYQALNVTNKRVNVNIVDNDLPTATVRAVAGAIEANAPGYFAINLDQALPGEVGETGLTVDYTISGSASPGSGNITGDFQPITGTTRIAPGEKSSALIAFPIDDFIVESIPLDVATSIASGGNQIGLKIADNAVIESTTLKAGTELIFSNGAVLTVQADTPLSKTSGTTVALQGAASQAISTNEGTQIPEETITVTLSAPSGGYRLGDQTSATLEILDNDVPGIRIIETSERTTVSEGGAAVNTYVSLLSQPKAPVTINIANPQTQRSIAVTSDFQGSATGTLELRLNDATVDSLLIPAGTTLDFGNGKSVTMAQDTVLNATGKSANVNAVQGGPVTTGDTSTYAYSELASTSSLTFNANNWYQLQPVAIEAIDDSVVEKNRLHRSTLEYTVSSTDSDYNGLNVPVQQIDILDRPLDKTQTINGITQGLLSFQDSLDTATLPVIGQLDGNTPPFITDLVSRVISDVRALETVTPETLANAFRTALNALIPNSDNFSFEIANLTTDEIEFFLTVNPEASSQQLALESDLGLSALGIGLKTDGTLDASFDYDLALGFGISKSDGFFLNTENTNFNVKTGLTFSPEFAAEGNLGFLRLDIANGTGTNGNITGTGLDATFDVSLDSSGVGNNDPRLSLSELNSLRANSQQLTDALVYNFTGDAALDLAVKTSVQGSSALPAFSFNLSSPLPLFNYSSEAQAPAETLTLDIGAATAINEATATNIRVNLATAPSQTVVLKKGTQLTFKSGSTDTTAITAVLQSAVTLSAGNNTLSVKLKDDKDTNRSETTQLTRSDKATIEKGTFDIAFKDIQLDFGSFVTDTISPVVNFIDDVIDPIRPIVNTLNSPIDFFSDVGLASLFDQNDDGDATILEVAAELLNSTNFNNPKQKVNYVKFFDAVVGVTDLVNAVSDLRESLASGETLAIEFGDYTLTDFRAASTTAKAADVNPRTKGTSQLKKNAKNQARNQSGTTADFTQKVDRLFGALDKLGIGLPILEDPVSAINLFLGRDIDLVTYDLPALEIDFDISKSFPIVPAVNGKIEGGFNLSSDLFFGLDTAGFSQWRDENFDPAKSYLTLDGLYLSDVDPETGEDVDELSVDATLGIGAELNVVIASASVTGGVEGYVGLDIVDEGEYDGTSDGRVRGSEVFSRINNPLQLFELSGALEAFFKGVVEVGVNLGFFKATEVIYEKEFARVPLFEFSLGAGGNGFAADAPIADAPIADAPIADAPIAGATVFFDANLNAVLDENEPFTTTDAQGLYNLDFDPRLFDTNANGEIDADEGRIVVTGGVDPLSGLPLEDTGTAFSSQSDNILSGGVGNDELFGTEGADTFRFTSALLDGIADTDIIRNYQAEDSLNFSDYLSAGGSIASTRVDSDHLRVTLSGEDVINVFGNQSALNTVESQLAIL